MNGTKLPDGGVLYDESDDDEDDVIQPEAEAASSLSGVQWNEGWKNESHVAWPS